MEERIDALSAAMPFDDEPATIDSWLTPIQRSLRSFLTPERDATRLEVWRCAETVYDRVSLIGSAATRVNRSSEMAQGQGIVLT